MRKGASVVVSSIFGIAILLAILGIVSVGTSQYYSRVSGTAQLAEAEALGQNLAAQIVTLYNINKDSGTNPLDGQTLNLSQVTMAVPAKIGGKDYKIELTPRGEYWAQLEIQVFGGTVEEISTDRQYASVKITTLDEPSQTFVITMNNLPVATEGSTSGKTTVTITYQRTRNGSVNSDKIVLS